MPQKALLMGHSLTHSVKYIKFTIYSFKGLFLYLEGICNGDETDNTSNIRCSTFCIISATPCDDEEGSRSALVITPHHRLCNLLETVVKSYIDLNQPSPC